MQNKKITIWAHSLVRNEERYVWFSVMSVIDYVDKILIWDTGSDDKTVEIISKIESQYQDKVLFKEVGKVNPRQFTEMSQKMLASTQPDWTLLLDGDEVWWDDSIRMVTDFVRESGDKIESVVQPYYNVIGDIFHYQSKDAGRYKIDGRKGHLTIRMLSRHIPGLHFSKEHGQIGLCDESGNLIQERSVGKRKYLDCYYLHFTNMLRSSTRKKDLAVPKRGFKYKYELGLSFPKDFFYPEVFFRPKPKIVPCPWQKRDDVYIVKALVATPFRKIKRKINLLSKEGY